MISFDQFCQEPFTVNLPSEKIAIVPQMMQTEDTTESEAHSLHQNKGNTPGHPFVSIKW